MLSRATKAKLYKGFDTAQLPAAIQDASEVCRWLGIRYLWVDTLCIIQDDEHLADWIRESALMGNVYENSLMNLSALAAPDTEHSFFLQRDPLDVSEVRIRTTLKCDTMRLGDVVNESRLVDPNLWTTSVQENHLNRRSWVMQERLLPVRVLHFGQHQLLWECAELHAAETYPLGLPKQTIISAIFNRSLPLQLRNLISKGSLQSLLSQGLVQNDDLFSKAYAAWDDLIYGYSKCKVTRGSDKLIAISGLAKRMALFVKDDYVVGMWRRRLQLELMWYCDNSHMTEAEYPGPRRPSEYRAPTFSWASMDAIIIPPHEQNNEHGIGVQILDLKLDFVAEDATGLCTGGYLTIKCRLQRTEIGYGDVSRLIGGRTVHIARSGTMTKIGPPILDELPSFFEPVARDDLYSVAWGTTKFDSRPVVWVRYLLLQVVDKDAGAFRRIGTSTHYGHPSDPSRYVSAGPEAVNYPCLSYNEGWHTIKII